MATTKWIIDPAHSEIRFKVKHLMISTVTGSFNSFQGNIETFDKTFTRGKSINFTAATHSIFTNHPERDKHLKSIDFFDADLYPQILFSANHFDMEAKEIRGNITIKGHTKEVVLEAEFGGITEDPQGEIRAGFSASGRLNRKDFDLSWDDVTNVGNVVVSDGVTLSIEIELVKN